MNAYVADTQGSNHDDYVTWDEDDHKVVDVESRFYQLLIVFLEELPTQGFNDRNIALADTPALRQIKVV